MNKIKILILEDDILFGLKIEIMLEDSNFQIVKICSNVSELRESIEKEEFDLLICDIMINGRFEGFEFIKSLKNPKFPIICITASNDEFLFAELIDLVAVYLVKPFHKITLLGAIQKAFKEFLELKVHEFVARKFVFVSGKSGKLEKINFSNILYLESAVNYSLIHTHKGKFAKKISLRKLIEDLLDERFIKVRHKFAVNTEHIVNRNSKEIELSNGLKFPVSRKYGGSLKEFLKRKVS